VKTIDGPGEVLDDWKLEKPIKRFEENYAALPLE
jgi:hypothetical protein